MAVAPAELIDVATCILCGSEEFRVAFAEPPYEVRRCVRCGLGWVSPRRTEEGLLDVYTDRSYWLSESPKAQGYSDYRAQRPLYLKTFNRRLEFVLGGRPHAGKALDVGCAAGFCMEAMAGLGFAPYGVDISADIVATARERLGPESVHLGTLETAPYAPGTFELITMWDVVEHVVDPRALLLRARELLAPDGLLVLETQNIDSMFARLLGSRWHHYKHGEHLYHFNPETIRSLLRSAGFEASLVTPRLGGKYVSLEFIAERASRVHPALTRILQPLTRVRSGGVYVNVMDEMIVAAVPAAQ